jgi:hypothetical protein
LVYFGLFVLFNFHEILANKNVYEASSELIRQFVVEALQRAAKKAQQEKSTLIEPSKIFCFVVCIFIYLFFFILFIFMLFISFF